MEEILKQSFTYARIQLFKNYSHILSKHVYVYPIGSLGNIEESIDPFQEPVKKFTVSAIEHPHSYDLRLFVKGKKKTNFFYTTTPTDSFENHAIPGHPETPYEPISLVCIKKLRNDYFETTKDRHIKAHYNNPFAFIELIKIERWIKRDGDKITLKMFVQSRNRNLNSIYFSKSTNSTTITFNIHTGDFRVIVYTQGRKTKTKHFYCNSFNALNQSLYAFYNIQNNHFSKKSPLYGKYIEEFNIIPFQISIKNILGLNDISFGTSSEIISNHFIKEWIPRFAEIKKIKLPDNGERLLKWYYPTERYLKKNNRKLIAAVLDRFKIKSKITIKILHAYPEIDIVNLVYMCRLFGPEYAKYIGNVTNYFYSDRGSENNDMAGKSVILHPTNAEDMIFNLSTTEKENIVHILNDICTQLPLGIQPRGIVHTFNDHFKMIYRLLPYYPEMKLNARKWETFNNEHAYYSRLDREIKKGYSIQFIFEPPVLREIEKPIEITVLNERPIMYCPTLQDKRDYEKMYANFPVSATKRVFEPKLLKNSEDYFDEGCYMNHCVAGYIHSDGSIIVSLRLGKERVTCEYEIKKRKCIQSRYHHNQEPPEYFKKALQILDDRILSIPFPIGPIDKKRVPIVINGIEVVPEVPIVFAEF